MSEDKYLQWRMYVPLGGHLITELVVDPAGTGRDFVVSCYGQSPVEPRTWTLIQDAEGNLTLQPNP